MDGIVYRSSAYNFLDVSFCVSYNLNMTIIVWINHTATPYSCSHLTVILATVTMAASGEMVARISLTPSLRVLSDCVKAEYFWIPDKMPSAAELGEVHVSAIIASVFPASALRRDVADSDPTFVVCIVHGESKRPVSYTHLTLPTKA